MSIKGTLWYEPIVYRTSREVVLHADDKMKRGSKRAKTLIVLSRKFLNKAVRKICP